MFLLATSLLSLPPMEICNTLRARARARARAKHRAKARVRARIRDRVRHGTRATARARATARDLHHTPLLREVLRRHGLDLLGPRGREEERLLRSRHLLDHLRLGVGAGLG